MQLLSTGRRRALHRTTGRSLRRHPPAAHHDNGEDVAEDASPVGPVRRRTTPLAGLRIPRSDHRAHTSRCARFSSSFFPVPAPALEYRPYAVCDCPSHTGIIGSSRLARGSVFSGAQVISPRIDAGWHCRQLPGMSWPRGRQERRVHSAAQHGVTGPYQARQRG